MFFYASAASDSSVTSSTESVDNDNPEPTPEPVRRSRGNGSTRIEAAAGESDDDGVFSDPTVLGVAPINFATSEAMAHAIATLYLVCRCVGVYLKECTCTMKSQKELAAHGALNLP